MPDFSPLIPANMPPNKVAKIGQSYPVKRPTQPIELASAYETLADPMLSQIWGEKVAVTGGKPLI